LKAGGSGEAPDHCGSIVSQAEAPVGTEKDDASVAAETIEEVGDGFAGREFGRRSCGDSVGSPLAEDELHDGLSPAGEGDGGREIVSIAAAADERGVADPARRLVERASRRGAGGEIAVGIKGNGADGVVGREGGLKSGLGTFVIAEGVSCEGLVGEAGCLPRLCASEALPFAIEDQLAVLDKGNAVGSREFFCSGTDEVDVGTLFENDSRGFDWIAEALDAGHAAGLHTAAIHEQRVELHAAIGGEEAAEARVEGGIVFKHDDGGFDCIKGGSAPRKDGITGHKSVADAGFVCGPVSLRNRPCAAVDKQDRRMFGARCHLPMVVHSAAGCDGGRGNKIVRRSRPAENEDHDSKPETGRQGMNQVTKSIYRLQLEDGGVRREISYDDLQGIIERLVKLRTFIRNQG
jgi:hypothetical protein